MITQENVPYSLAEINPNWLTQIMQDSGLLKGQEVTDITLNKLSDGVGFNGELAVLKLKYSNESSDAPRTMVIKIPTTGKNRILGQTMGLYEKEIRFYRDLASTLNIQTPQHYCSALDVADDPDEILERLAGLNKLPMWLIGVLSKAATWFVSKTPRRYVLLIEDLSEQRMGDQDSGCTISDTQKIVTTMAALHAQFWSHKDLEKMSWIAPMATTSKIIHSMFLPAVKNLRTHLHGDQLELGEWLLENGVAINETLGQEAPTLLHGDIRLDNICFNDQLGTITLLDWQTMQAGPPGLELAYFISATLPADASEEQIDELMRLYHQYFVEAGGRLSLPRLKWQYQLGMLGMLHRMLPQRYSEQTDTGDRGPEFFEDWIEKVFSRLKPVDHNSIFTSAPD